jgi:cation:H+ antiporter
LPSARGDFSVFLLRNLIEQMESVSGPWLPLVHVGLFLAASLLIVWRLEIMTRRGIEGTVLGTVFMPYFSGLGNLIFVGVVLRQDGPPGEVAVNSLVNNVTNLCLLLTIPALIWGLNLRSESKKKKDQVDSQLHRLSLSLTLVAMIFFSLIVWVLSRDGTIDRYDGIALVGLFLFWQSFHVYEVLKENTRRGETWSPVILFDLGLILAGSYVTLISVDGIVGWILQQESGPVGAHSLGVVTGILMVLPNAVLAFYYAYRRRADVVYASQIGDGHICIPLCIGLFAIVKPMPVSADVGQGLLFLAGAALLHLLCVGFLRRLPGVVALALIVAFVAAASFQLV